MSKKKLYLAGPISGCTFGECTDWRKEFARFMPPAIDCLSPMRSKEPLAPGALILDHVYQDSVFGQDSAIMQRDHNDCTTADCVVANFLGATRVSIGTVMEAAWCYHRHIPLIAVLEDDGSNCHDNHCMMRRAIGFRVATLEQAVIVARSILNV